MSTNESFSTVLKTQDNASSRWRIGRPAAILGVLLGFSALTNLVLLLRAVAPERRIRAGVRPERATVPRDEPEDSSCVSPTASAGPVSPRPEPSRPTVHPSTVDSPREDPEVTELLKEQEALGFLWDELNRLLGIRKSLGEDRYKETVLRVTARFLEIDEARFPEFTSSAEQMVRDFQRVTSEYRDACRRLAGSAGERDAARRFEEQRERAGAGIRRILGSSARHRQFLDQISAWAGYFLAAE